MFQRIALDGVILLFFKTGFHIFYKKLKKASGYLFNNLHGHIEAKCANGQASGSGT
jgi:hypothetical protein